MKKMNIPNDQEEDTNEVDNSRMNSNGGSRSGGHMFGCSSK